MVYEANENTRLRARQLQRFRAHSKVNLQEPLQFCEFISPDSLGLAVTLKPHATFKLPNREKDWVPNWTMKQCSPSTTIREFVATAMEILHNLPTTREQILFNDRSLNAVAEEEEEKEEMPHNEDAPTEPIYLSGSNNTTSTVHAL